MAKSAKKPVPAHTKRAVSAGKSQATGKEARVPKPASVAPWPHGPTDSSKPNKPASDTKQSRVLSLLRSPAGATITAMMQATGWQQHSVRGFLAGVVRKRLGLKLTSKKVDGIRVYQIAGSGRAKTDVPQPKARRAA